MSGIEETKEAIRNAANKMVPSATYGDQLMAHLTPVFAIAGVSGNQDFLNAVGHARDAILGIKECTARLAKASQTMLDYADRL